MPWSLELENTVPTLRIKSCDIFQFIRGDMLCVNRWLPEPAVVKLLPNPMFRVGRKSADESASGLKEPAPSCAGEERLSRRNNTDANAI